MASCSPSAPAFVLFRAETIDDRFPNLDDAPVLVELLRFYTPVLKEREWLLLRRQPDGQPLLGDPVEIANGEIAAGEYLPIPPGVVWCELDIRDNLLAPLVRFLWQQPRVFVDVCTAEDDHPQTYRMISSMAVGGFLVSPLIEKTDDFSQVVNGFPTDGPTVSRLRIKASRSARWLTQ